MSEDKSNTGNRKDRAEELGSRELAGSLRTRMVDDQTPTNSTYESLFCLFSYLKRFIIRLCKDAVVTLLCYFYSNNVLPDHILDLIRVHQRLLIERETYKAVYSRELHIQDSFKSISEIKSFVIINKHTDDEDLHSSDIDAEDRDGFCRSIINEALQFKHGQFQTDIDKGSKQNASHYKEVNKNTNTYTTFLVRQNSENSTHAHNKFLQHKNVQDHTKIYKNTPKETWQSNVELKLIKGDSREKNTNKELIYGKHCIQLSKKEKHEALKNEDEVTNYMKIKKNFEKESFNCKYDQNSSEVSNSQDSKETCINIDEEPMFVIVDTDFHSETSSHEMLINVDNKEYLYTTTFTEEPSTSKDLQDNVIVLPHCKKLESGEELLMIDINLQSRTEIPVNDDKIENESVVISYLKNRDKILEVVLPLSSKRKSSLFKNMSKMETIFESEQFSAFLSSSREFSKSKLK